MQQLDHNQTINRQQQFPITIVCDAIRTPENIGMCFRISESFGVSKIYIHENSPSLENNTVKRTARNTLNKVSSDYYSDIDLLITNLKKEGNIIIGLELTDESTDIQDFDFTKYKKIVLLLGNERQGINKLTPLDISIAIPMYGKNSSMNVIHSLAIALYEITNQLQK